MKLKSMYSYILTALFIGLFSNSCQDEDFSAGTITTPTDLQLQLVPSTDGSGKVTITYSAKNAITNKIEFGTTTSPNSGKYLSSAASKTFDERYFTSGTYTVKYTAYGTGGAEASITATVTVAVAYQVPTSIVNHLTNGTTKTWKWDKNNAGHLGVGPSTKNFPEWYAASANEKPTCLYDDDLIFTLNTNGSVSFQNVNQTETFIHIYHQQSLVGSNAGSDACFAYTTGTSTVGFADANSGLSNSTGVMMSLGTEFMSYALATNTYEIMTLTDTELYVRTLETAPDGSKRAWYQRFVSNATTNCSSGFTGNQSGSGSYVLVWAVEFLTNGAPCSNNWGYDLGAGGWGNNEAQYYTNRPENVKIENGSLKITAIKEPYLGANYTSTRLKSQDLFEFKYGRVEVRAKLPTTGGTWPAIWMLGANFPEVGWPSCGEIDIMEHKGNEVGKIYGTTHTLAGSGGNAVGGFTNITNVNDWHIYSMEWTAQNIKFFVDGNLFYTYSPSQNASNWPYNNPQFLLLNFAMGGTFGGTISPTFTQETFEIDYVRVYQK